MACRFLFQIDIISLQSVTRRCETIAGGEVPVIERSVIDTVDLSDSSTIQVKNAQRLVLIVVMTVVPESIAVIVERGVRIGCLEIKLECTEKMSVSELSRILHKKGLVVGRLTLLHVGDVTSG